MQFHFSIRYVPGKELNTADHLSRSPMTLMDQVQDAKDREFQSNVEAFVNLVVNNLPASDKRLREIQQHQEKDPILQKVKDHCLKGTSCKRDLPLSLAQVLPEISTKDNLLLKGNRIIIPKSLQAEVLKQIHTGHQV